jgi:hypothetical protein
MATRVDEKDMSALASIVTQATSFVVNIEVAANFGPHTPVFGTFGHAGTIP